MHDGKAVAAKVSKEKKQGEKHVLARHAGDVTVASENSVL